MSKHATWATLALIIALLAVPASLFAQGSGIPATEGNADFPAGSGPFADARPLNGGGTLYLTSLDSGTTVFAAYDPGTDAWTQLNSYDTSCQMAVSAAGDLFAVNISTGDIDLYDPGTDTWSYYMDGPPVATGSKCNLEVTNDGEFFMTVVMNTNLYYTSGGSWNTFTMPFNGNAMGDYDPTSNQLVVGEYGTVYAHLIDVDTFAITDFLLGPGSNGEYGRFSSVMNNRYYYCTGSDPVYSYDLSDPNLPAYDHGVYPGFYVSSAADRANNLIYTASLDGTLLWAFDAGTDTLIPLAGNSYTLWHSSLAFVPEGGVQNTIHVEDIMGWFDYPYLQMRVLVADENGAHLGNVFVDVTIDMPAVEWGRWRYTRPNGWARFWAPTYWGGNYQICVDDLVLAGYTYDPDQNVYDCMDWDYVP
jgi:hypothetical protein